jgi:hypothetical protein
VNDATGGGVKQGDGPDKLKDMEVHLKKRVPLQADSGIRRPAQKVGKMREGLVLKR